MYAIITSPINERAKVLEQMVHDFKLEENFKIIDVRDNEFLDIAAKCPVASPGSIVDLDTHEEVTPEVFKQFIKE